MDLLSLFIYYCVWFVIVYLTVRSITEIMAITKSRKKGKCPSILGLLVWQNLSLSHIPNLKAPVDKCISKLSYIFPIV